MLREDLHFTTDRDRLLFLAWCWLYEHRDYHADRMLRRMIAASIQQFATELAASIQASVGHDLLSHVQDWAYVGNGMTGAQDLSDQVDTPLVSLVQR